MITAENYSATATTADGVEIIRLTGGNMQVSIAPSIGNMAYEMTVKGQPIFWSPYKTVGELKAKPTFAGNPFLSPWANRLDQDAFWANGRKYQLNPGLGNIRRDGSQQPIHGLVSYSDKWTVTGKGADDKSAWVTSRLDFWRVPQWMAQFPFAHWVEMTYRLTSAGLEVDTVYQNESEEPMPLVIGYHPYFTMPGAARDDWQVHLAARDHVTLSAKLTPTGERTPVERADFGLRGTQLDDVYTNLSRDGEGRAEFSVSAGGKKIAVVYGPKYTVAVVYAPKGREFICFEPMTGVTNGANLNHDGKYPELQSIPGRGRWEERFWIHPTGF